MNKFQDYQKWSCKIRHSYWKLVNKPTYIYFMLWVGRWLEKNRLRKLIQTGEEALTYSGYVNSLNNNAIKMDIEGILKKTKDIL